MKKSIVKVKLNSRADFIETLDEINFHFTEPYWQHDRIFVPKNYSRDKSLPRLSLRTIVKDPNKDATYALVLRRHFEDKKIDIINSVIDSLPGYYSKIESDLSENDDSIAAREDLIETFKVLGVKRVTPIDQTYGELLDSSLHDTITG